MAINPCPVADNEMILREIANAPHWVFGYRLRDLSQAFADSSTSIKRLEGNPGWSGASADAAKTQISRMASRMANNSSLVADIRVKMQEANAVLDEAKNRLANLPEAGLGFWDSAGTWLGAVFDGEDVDEKIQEKEHEKSIERENAAKSALDDIQSRLHQIAVGLSQVTASIERESPIHVQSPVPRGPGYAPGGGAGGGPGSGGPTVGPPRGGGGSMPPLPTPGDRPSGEWPRDERGRVESGGGLRPSFPSGENDYPNYPGYPTYPGGPGYVPGDYDNGYEYKPGPGYTPGPGYDGGSSYTGSSNNGYSSSPSADSSMSGGTTSLGGAGLAGGAAAAGLGVASKLGAGGLASGLNGAGLSGTLAAPGAAAAAGTTGSSAGGSSAGGRGGMGMMGGGGAAGGSDKDKKSGSLGLIAPKLEDEDPRIARKASGAKAGSRESRDAVGK
ncbi:hypothetical protein [Lysinibacter cavernae]|uniref:Uncharacterized protein n=1 Tax=Lysinibacter cavernae TaxID=1640652 RepID=A0A7X5R1Q7_9MICO|nr:hypothetical protein [Lysinibacter cavernae]NIH53989.1 hypothetical protein [Lysinibacter cavernae]